MGSNEGHCNIRYFIIDSVTKWADLIFLSIYMVLTDRAYVQLALL